MAGLAAGRALAEAGATVTIVEARNRVGGRIHTLRTSGETFELGAEFVHGLPPELWQVIREANFRTEELAGKKVCCQHGELTDCGQQWEQDFERIERLKEWKEPDCSFAEYLTRSNIEGEQRQHLVSYVEGFNAADHQTIGVASLAKQQAAEDAIEGGRLFRLCEGYSQIPEFVADQFRRHSGDMLLNAPVQSVAWRPGEVRLTCTVNGERCRIPARL